MPQAVWLALPSNVQAPEHLAYIKLFTCLTNTPHHNHRMYIVKWHFGQDGDHLTIIIPLSSLHSSMHLYPPNLDLLHLTTGPATQSLTDVSFYISPLSSCYAYFIIQ